MIVDVIGDWPKLDTPIVLSLSIAGIDDEVWPRLRSILSPAEAARATAFHHDADRRSFIAAHALLRLGLGAILDVDPASFAFAQNAYGKPRLSGRAGGELEFNISHSRGLVVAGFVRGAAIGVDTESVARLEALDADAIVQVLSPDERAALTAFSGAEWRARIVDLWTLKESVIKALGQGLSMSLASFSIDPDRLTAVGLDVDCCLALWRNEGHRVAAVVLDTASMPRHGIARFVKHNDCVGIRIE